jgi:hypothetical protein
MMVMKKKHEVPPHLCVLHLKTHREFQALEMMEVVDVVIIAPFIVIASIHPIKQQEDD